MHYGSQKRTAVRPHYEKQAVKTLAKTAKTPAKTLKFEAVKPVYEDKIKPGFEPEPEKPAKKSSPRAIFHKKRAPAVIQRATRGGGVEQDGGWSTCSCSVKHKWPEHLNRTRPLFGTR